MKITRRMRNHYLKVLLKAVLLGGCILIAVIVSWRCCLQRLSRIEEKENICLYVLNKDMEAGEVLKEDDMIVQNVLSKEWDMKKATIHDFLGKHVKFTLKKDTILSDELVTEKNENEENVRKVCYSYMRNAYELKKGDYIDVRIAFPNGADFIILSKKEVLATEKNQNEINEGIWLSVTEEELLRMSSGVVDASMFDEAYIYATLYVDMLQRESVVNYPVNEVVEMLIKKNPNIVTIAQERETLKLRNKSLTS